MRSKNKWVLLIVVATVALASLLIYLNWSAISNVFIKNSSSEDSKVSAKNLSEYDFKACGDVFVKLHNDAISNDPSMQAQEKVSEEYATVARNIPSYKDDMNCLAVSLVDYINKKDPTNSRLELEKFKVLLSENPDGTGINSLSSVDAMEILVFDIENPVKEGDIDGRG